VLSADGGYGAVRGGGAVTSVLRERRPPASSAVVSAQMSRMPRASSGPELALRRELHRRGLRFRVNAAWLPGRPDVVFTRRRLAVFVDGCFWHRCPEHGTLPRANGEWWLAKLDRNVARDAEKDRALVGLGWLPLHIWEHENVQEAADRIGQEWLVRFDGGVTAGCLDEERAAVASWSSSPICRR
jgi:DNA mismatch endonuclease (patch repair protein)